MLLGRRELLKKSLMISAASVLPLSVARAQEPEIQLAELRGTFAGQDYGLRPGLSDDQSRKFQAALNKASEANEAVFLSPGEYRISNIKLPERTRLIGVPGATRLVFAGNSHFLYAEGAMEVFLQGLILDGLNRKMPDYAQGLFSANSVRSLTIDNCAFLGSGNHGLDLVGCAGHVRNSTISGIADIALFAKESAGLTISNNTIKNIGNGGILVHRFTEGEDKTIVSNNRIEKVRSTFGGTGQWGNGINIFRAHNVSISGNQISDCAFSAIRGNTAKNLQIIGNQCLRSGETALYSEFGHDGTIVANNLVDGGTIGVSIANFNSGGRLASVTGNIIRNIHDRLPYVSDQDLKPGIGISVEADTVVSSNTIENTPQYGVLAGWGPYLRNVAVMSNIIRKVPYGIGVSVAPGVGTALIKDNMLQGVERRAISGWEWTKEVTGELASSRSSGYDHLNVSGNVLMG